MRLVLADVGWGFAVGGCTTEPGQSGDNCTKVTLDYVLTSSGVFPDMKIRDVLNPKDGPLCYDYDSYP